MKQIFNTGILFLVFLLLDNNAYAAQTELDPTNTAWIMVCTALVMFMTPGLALFYGGMVNKKHMIGTIMHSYMKLCIITVIWVLIGYSIAFGDSVNGLFGDLTFLGFENIVGDIVEDIGVPHMSFALFQGMFAVITAAIITGSFAERVRLRASIIFTALWTIVVYAPIAHWVWGGGFIDHYFDPLDFAGGAVVHISSAIAGLVAAIFLGKRIEYKAHLEPHNVPMTILGAAILWFGWFGFNAGSALAADEIATLAFTNTAIAAAAGGTAWYLVEIAIKGKASSVGTVSGSIVGLVAITPAAGFVTPGSAIIIGLIGSPICYWAVNTLKPKIGYDDSLDVFGIHGIGGIWGAIATGLFATTSVNADGIDGLFYGNTQLVIDQIITSTIIITYSAIVTYILLNIINRFIKIRLSEYDERRGLDISTHGEEIY